MMFITELSAHLVSLESQVSINFILVHCDTNAQLVDIERNLAILSIVNQEKVLYDAMHELFTLRDDGNQFICRMLVRLN